MRNKRCKDCGADNLYDVEQHKIEDCPKGGPKTYCGGCRTWVNNLAAHRALSRLCWVEPTRAPSGGRPTISAGLFSLGKGK